MPTDCIRKKLPIGKRTFYLLVGEDYVYVTGEFENRTTEPMTCQESRIINAEILKILNLINSKEGEI